MLAGCASVAAAIPPAKRRHRSGLQVCVKLGPEHRLRAKVLPHGRIVPPQRNPRSDDSPNVVQRKSFRQSCRDVPDVRLCVLEPCPGSFVQNVYSLTRRRGSQPDNIFFLFILFILTILVLVPSSVRRLYRLLSFDLDISNNCK